MPMIDQKTNFSPCLHWAGGKTQIIDRVKSLLVGKEFNTYYEPFVGGGSVLLLVLKMLEAGEVKINTLSISDINFQLISLYNAIKNTPVELMNEIDRLFKSYKEAKVVKYEKRHKYNITTLDEAQAKSKSDVYYWFRKRYNDIKEPCIEVSALFMILNKTCYRGLYRTSKNGFNVSYGNYVNPTVYKKQNIINLSRAFNKYNVIFTCRSYETINPNANDITYLDPPYVPAKKGGFDTYAKGGFDHKSFIEFCKKQHNFIQNNTFCDFIVNNYKGYTFEKILCKRKINSKNPEDTAYEIMISKFN